MYLCNYGVKLTTKKCSRQMPRDLPLLAPSKDLKEEHSVDPHNTFKCYSTKMCEVLFK